MATVTVFSAERMKDIEDAGIASAAIVANHLILTKVDGTTLDAGAVNILTSPNGTNYRLLVSNAGVLSTELVT